MESLPIHQTAASGFNRDAKKYDKARPSYPAEAVASMIQQCQVDPQTATVVDVACGTGKFTRVLLNGGFKNIIGIEPVADMRRVFSENFPDLKIIDAAADSMPLKAESVDIVTVAQAFHWFSNMASLDEFARILKPGGHLVFIWNEQDENQAWVKDLVEFMWQWKDDAPQHRDMKWKNVLAEQTRFGPFSYAEFPNPLQMDRQGVIDRVFSTSFIARQPEDQAKIIREGVIAILDKHGAFLNGATGQYPYSSQLHIAKKL